MASSGDDFSDLQSQHRVTLFPSLGYYDLKLECWRAMVHGRVSMAGPVSLSRRLLLKGLKAALDVHPDEVLSDTFQARIGEFLAAPGRRRRIVLEIAGVRYRLRRKTRRNGAFWGLLNLHSPPTPHELQKTQAITLCQSKDELDGSSPVTGTLHLAEPHGLSVVSDIDDTIKLTETTSRRQMLANTFLHPFAVVEGMPELYQHWQQAGCDFHYVSRSPWELYGPLSELCTTSGFPPGSMHLRYFRVRDEMLHRFRSIRRSVKSGIIIDLLKRLPQRRFVMVGDSGEVDPEIYRHLAERFPGRIAAILIREMPSAPISGKRLRKLHSIPTPIQLVIFRQPEQVREIVTSLVKEVSF